jgi:hypothetical protein
VNRSPSRPFFPLLRTSCPHTARHAQKKVARVFMWAVRCPTRVLKKSDRDAESGLVVRKVFQDGRRPLERRFPGIEPSRFLLATSTNRKLRSCTPQEKFFCKSRHEKRASERIAQKITHRTAASEPPMRKEFQKCSLRKRGAALVGLDARSVPQRECPEVLRGLLSLV